MRKHEYLHDRALVSFKSEQSHDRLLRTPDDDLALAFSASPSRGGLRTLSAVYVIANDANPLLKIGYADNLRSRVSGLNCGSPVNLRLVHFVYFVDAFIAKMVEGDAHKTLAEHRRKGEWFDVTAGVAGQAIANSAISRRLLWFSERERIELGSFMRLHDKQEAERARLFGT